MMPAAPSEPEKYSIDEMMSRLTGSASDDPAEGELVTRSDGSQAVRVRKRKRRSNQPHKEKSEKIRRSRMVQVSAALILIFLAALAVGGAVVYANSKPFRDGLIRMIGESSGGTPALQTFRMNPRTANAGSLTLDWPAGNVLKNLTLRGLIAEISPTSFFGKSLNGEEIRVAQASLTLRIPNSSEARRAINKPETAIPIQFKRYRTPLFNLTLTGEDTTVLSLLKSEASLSNDTSSGFPQLSLYRGDLAIPEWPRFRIDRALIGFRGDATEIVGLRVLHEINDRGSLTFSGTISPFKPDQVSILSVNVDAFEISGLVGPALGHLISGSIDSISSAKSSFLSFRPTEDSSPVMEVTFNVSPLSAIELNRFPFLFNMSYLLDEDKWFEKPLFDSDATGVIHREKGVVSFRNLNLESKGRMTIMGDLSMAANQTLSGNLRVGLPESIIPKTSRLKAMLSPAEDGFRWISLKIGGTAAAPSDDFKELYDQSRMPVETAPATSGTEGSTFDELTRPR